MRISTLTTPLGPDYLLLKKIEGTEGLNTLFRYVLDAYSIHDDIAPRSLLGQAVSVSIDDQNGNPVYLNALVSQFKRIGRKRGARYTQYEAVLVPWLWIAQHRVECRIFESKTALDIIIEVVGFYPFPVSCETGGGQKLLHVVQYNESDFAFVCRLMEEHGINYRFAHEADRHTLVLSTSVSAFGTVPGHDIIPFRATDSTVVLDEETISTWIASQTITPGSFKTSDYDFREPGANLEANSTGSYPVRKHAFADLPVYLWMGQQHYTDPHTGASIAGLRQDQQEQDFAHTEADSSVRALLMGATGLRFTLARHPEPAFNEAVTVIATEMSYKENSGATDGGGDHTDWRVSIKVVSAKHRYRPQRVTPLPYIRGPQTAIVVGPEGQEVWINDLGMVKIRLWWDRNTPGSGWELWVRVSRGWAGRDFGDGFHPRIGDEVVVLFLDGNPDHPVIVAGINNANRLPVAFSRTGSLPSNQALAGIKSREFFGSGYGQMFFDDTTGEISSHFQSDHAKTQLNLGYLTHERSGSAEPRGNGFELRTDAAGVLRAAHGLFLTTDSRPRGMGNALSRTELTEILKEALALAKTLGEFAAKNLGNISDPVPQEALSKAVKDLGHGTNAETGENGGQPIVAVSAPAGFALGTPKSATIATGEHLDLVSDQNQHLTAGKNINVHAGESISSFAMKGDVKSIAHKGKNIIQAHNNEIEINADKSLTITSSHDHVTVAADKYVEVTAGGAYIKLIGGNILMRCPGTFDVKAGEYNFTGPESLDFALPKLPSSEPFCVDCLLRAMKSGSAVAMNA